MGPTADHPHDEGDQTRRKEAEEGTTIFHRQLREA